ncbi:fungal specific transcription factor [Phlyctema vagabunda]|uniref:Fungal specific transcription factor n=1 Tax=Phlyctema vagabunda TaxID=108571 RepID=A0ABR4PVF0_9HELO
MYTRPGMHINETVSRNTIFQKPGTPYGTTRFSAVFSENQASFGSAMSEVARDELESQSKAAAMSEGRINEERERTRMELAISTLMYFPSEQASVALRKAAPFSSDVWLSMAMLQSCEAQIWSDYGIHLGPQRCRASLAQMSRDLLANTRKPLQISESSHWRNWFSGPLLRWEMIGLVFAWVGFSFKHLQDWDPIFELPELKGRANRNAAADKMRECADACLQLCEVTGELNELMLVLMKNSWKLQSNIVSDESDVIRTASGIIGSACMTAGLHRLPPSSPTNITPLSQYHITLAASLYYLDKCESLFNARPPILSRHYCRWELPLDLSEEELFGGPERLATAVANLDERGWNTKGDIYNVTWLRALCLQIPIREEILELSLGIDAKYTWEHIQSLIARHEENTSSYPAHMRYSSLTTSSLPRQIYLLTRLRLDVLQCHFLLQRLAVKQGYTSSQRLLEIALEMMHLVLSLWLKRDALRDWCYAFDWLVVCYGIPAAGVLCIALLNSTTKKTDSTGSSSSSQTAAPRADGMQSAKPAAERAKSERPLRFSRSEVIQCLTMFIAHLAWIRPSDGNEQLCWKLHKVVKQIVDGVLDHDADAEPGGDGAEEEEDEQGEDDGGGDGEASRDDEVARREMRAEEMGGVEETIASTGAGAAYAPGLGIGMGMGSGDGIGLGMGMASGMTIEDAHGHPEGGGEIDWLNTIDWTQGGWAEFGGQEIVFQ